MKIFDITGDSYTSEIENYDGTVLIDFFSANCMPCKMISPVIEKVADKAEPQVKVCKVDVEKERDLAKKFGIMSVPTVVVLKNGKVSNRSIGVTGEKTILDMLR